MTSSIWKTRKAVKRDPELFQRIRKERNAQAARDGIKNLNRILEEKPKSKNEVDL